MLDCSHEATVVNSESDVTSPVPDLDIASIPDQNPEEVAGSHSDFVRHPDPDSLIRYSTTALV